MINKSEKEKIRSRAVVLCPDNDAEAHLILKLANKAGMTIIRSLQPHGAKLEKEPKLIKELLKIGKPEVWIVEIPGPDKEKEIEENSIKVVVIDHHTYKDMDRLIDPKTGEKKPSSLEQFLILAQIDDDEMKLWGFDPRTVRGIGISDALYVHGLRQSGYSDEELKKVYKLELEINKVIYPDYEELLKLAEKDWENRKELGDYLLIKSTNDGRIRKFISEVSILKGEDNKPMILQVIGAGDYGEKISVQNVDSKIIDKLNKNIKGNTFTFGSGRCWGANNKEGEEKVTLDDVLNVLELK